MEVILLDSAAYQRMLSENKDMIAKAVSEAIKECCPTKQEKVWLTEKEAQELLPYRSKTKWQELRDRGLIIYSQFGRKILYQRESILNYIKSKELQ